ncbi:MAG: DUF58 domain-containing protein [Bacteroidetes bacterium]|nr:DUF58 domain-containing protein [Bacteroidota bacterium]
MRKIKNIINSIYLSRRFYIALGAIGFLFASAFYVPIFYTIAQVCLLLIAITVLTDILILLGSKNAIKLTRITDKVLSLGSINKIKLEVYNNSNFQFSATIIDELPHQLEERNFEIDFLLDANSNTTKIYSIKPTARGIYNFGQLNIFIKSFLKLAELRIRFDAQTNISVYPSILLMKEFELHAFKKNLVNSGIKRMRRIGQSSEFEQIKNYVFGDNYKNINWKATGKKSSLMINQYEDEKSQTIYCIIDKSRVMHMPFNGLSLLDYAINSSLVISNIIIHKEDKVGLLTFSNSINTFIKANKGKHQLKKILEALYAEEESLVETDYQTLYFYARKAIPNRSLLFFYTNFESIEALHNILPTLINLNKFHLLVVVFFENTELLNILNYSTTDTQTTYQNAIVEKYLVEKQLLKQLLSGNGIMCILTTPDDLIINTVNKYLELKARNLI